MTGLDTATGQSRQAHAEQIAPGSYRAEFDLSPATFPDGGGNDTPGAATTMFSVSSPELMERPYVFGHTRSYPKEFVRTDTDENFLRGVASAGHGRYDPKPEQVFAPPAGFSARRVDLTNYFLAAALILLPIDIFLRRRTWKQPPTLRPAGTRRAVAT